MTCVASGGSCAAGGWVFNVHQPHQHGYVARLCRARAGGLEPSMAYQQLQPGWGHSVMHPWALQPSTLLLPACMPGLLSGMAHPA